MTPRFTRLPRLPRHSRFLAAPLGLLLILCAAAAVAAPEYALSGRAPELAESVLARTPAGPVTALDVLMLDEMRDRALAQIPIDAWLNPNALEAAPYRPAMKSAVERLLAYRVLAAKAGDWEPAADVLRVKSFGAAMAVWTELAVKPQVKVVETIDPQSGRTVGDIDRYYLAHPEKYLRRLRAQVRYIFLAANMGDPADKTRVRNELEEVARAIQEGELSFEQAARRFSEAPSAAQGGLLPPFYNGTFFREFDRQTFLLDRPGKLSPVFEGPEGYYLVQLAQAWPAQNIPIAEVRDEIRETLRHDFVRHYYAYLFSKLLEQRYVVNMAGYWNYLNLQAPIVQIDGTARLERPEFFRYFGNPVGAAYETQMIDILGGAGYWTEGEIIAAEVAALGQGAHPWIERARTLAALPLKADQYYSMAVPQELYAPSQALATVRNNKQFVQGLRSARVIEFEIRPRKGGGDREEGGAPGQAEIASLTNTLTAQLAGGVLPLEPNPIKLAEWLQRNAETPAQIPAAVEKLQSEIDASPWPGVQIRLHDRDWIDTVPGTPWYEALKAVGVGQMSAPVRLATGTTHQYLVAAERPVDLAEWEAKPVLLRALAFQIEASKLFAAELLRIRQSGAVTYTFE